MRRMTETTADDARHRAVPVAGLRLDAVGGLLWLSLAAWVVYTGRTPQEAAPVRDLLLMMAVVYVLARLVTRLHSWVVPAVLLGLGTLVAAWTIGAVLSGSGDDPFGYDNATGAFALAAVAAGLMVFARVRNAEARATVLCATAACGLVPWMIIAITSALLTLVLPVALVARDLGSRVRGVIVQSAVAALVVLAGTAAVGATYDGRGWVDWIVMQTLSGNRAQLWSEALELVAEHPMTGVGTNRFARESPTARGDADLGWAHNDYLQLAAETGLPGLALALALLLWVFARLWFGQRDSGTGVAAAGLAVLSIAASIDYVWHFPAVAMATAALAGSGTGAVAAVRTVPSTSRHRERRIDATVAGDAFWPQQPEHGHH